MAIAPPPPPFPASRDRAIIYHPRESEPPGSHKPQPFQNLDPRFRGDDGIFPNRDSVSQRKRGFGADLHAEKTEITESFNGSANKEEDPSLFPLEPAPLPRNFKLVAFRLGRRRENAGLANGLARQERRLSLYGLDETDGFLNRSRFSLANQGDGPFRAALPPEAI